MITVFDDTQRSHAPREFIVSGKPQPIPERPERIDMLMEGVRRIAGPIVAPPEIFGDTIALVHERRYIQFLSTLHERWRRIPDAAETPSPNVFALGRANLERFATRVRQLDVQWVEERLADIGARYGARVAGIVRACSDSLEPEGADKRDWEARKREHLARLGRRSQTPSA